MSTITYTNSGAASEAIKDLVKDYLKYDASEADKANSDAMLFNPDKFFTFTEVEDGIEIARTYTTQIAEARIKGGKALMALLVADGWHFRKNGKVWIATSPAGQEQSHSSLNWLLLESSWHPMYMA